MYTVLIKSEILSLNLKSLSLQPAKKTVNNVMLEPSEVFFVKF